MLTARYSSLLLLSISLLTITSCNKDDKDAGNRETGILGIWTTNFKAKDINDNKVLEGDETQPIDLATHTYKDNGTGTVVGKISGQQSNYDFQWRFVAKQRAIIISTFAGSDSVIVDELTASKLVLRYADRDTLRWIGLKR